jgi:hypothetical protein
MRNVTGGLYDANHRLAGGILSPKIDNIGLFHIPRTLEPVRVTADVMAKYSKVPSRP